MLMRSFLMYSHKLLPQNQKISPLRNKDKSVETSKNTPFLIKTHVSLKL